MVEEAYMKAKGMEEYMMDFMVLLQHLRCFLERFRIQGGVFKQIVEAGSVDADR